MSFRTILFPDKHLPRKMANLVFLDMICSKKYGIFSVFPSVHLIFGELCSGHAFQGPLLSISMPQSRIGRKVYEEEAVITALLKQNLVMSYTDVWGRGLSSLP